MILIMINCFEFVGEYIPSDYLIALPNDTTYLISKL